MAKRQFGISTFKGYSETNRGIGYACDCDGFRINNDGSLGRCAGLTEIETVSSRVNKMWCGTLNGRKTLVYVADSILFKHDIDNGLTAILSSIGTNDPMLFEFDGKLYIIGDDYYCFDGTSISTVEGYIPTVSVSTLPSGSGTPYESVNMLTSKRKQLFSPDGTSTEFQLAEKSVLSIEEIRLNGETVSELSYSLDQARGKVLFDTAVQSGTNSLEITYSMESSNRTEFLQCRYAILFGSNADERIFLWGNADKPCYRYHSEPANGVPSAEFFPVMNYTVIGSTAITDICQQYNKQLIFTADSAYYSYCETRISVSGQQYASFPVLPLSSLKGNLLYGSSCAYNGQPVTLCRDGINIWASTEIENEKNSVCISLPVNTIVKPAVLNNGKNALLFNCISRNELIFYYNNTMLFYNYFNNSWYKCGNVKCTAFAEGFGNVYVAGNGKVCKLSDGVRSFPASYTSYNTNLGSDKAKGIESINITVKAGHASKGSVKVIWQGKSGSRFIEKTFETPYALVGKEVTVNIPLFIPSVTSIAVEFNLGSNKDMHILRYGIVFRER